MTFLSGAVSLLHHIFSCCHLLPPLRLIVSLASLLHFANRNWRQMSDDGWTSLSQLRFSVEGRRFIWRHHLEARPCGLKVTDDRCDGARRARLNRGISLEQFFNQIPEQFWTVEEEFEFLRLITMMEIHSEWMQNDWIGMEWIVELIWGLLSIARIYAQCVEETAARQKKEKQPSVAGQTWNNDWNLIDTMTMAITWVMKMIAAKDNWTPKED